MKAKTPVPREHRKVGKVLFWCIALAPYLFAWITLRDGYPQRVRVLSLGWLAIFGFGYTAAKLDQMSSRELQVHTAGQTKAERDVRSPTLTASSNERGAPQSASATVPPSAAAVRASPGATVAELRARLAELKKANKDQLYDLKLPGLRAELDALPEADRVALEARYKDVVKRASPVKAKYAAQTARDAAKILNFTIRETVIKSALSDLEGAEGSQAEKARAQIAQSIGKLDEDRAATAVLRQKCGDVTAGEYSVRTYLRRFAKDPDSIKVDRCSTPVLTERCWQMQCEYFGKNSFGGPTREVVTVWSQAGVITASDI